MAPKQTDPQFKLRMTPEIKDAIEKAAEANARSMNAEILHRLQQTIDAERVPSAPDLPPGTVVNVRYTEEDIAAIVARAMGMMMADEELREKIEEARTADQGGGSTLNKAPPGPMGRFAIPRKMHHRDK